MKSIEYLKKLYGEGKYQGIKDLINEEDFRGSRLEDAEFLLQLAWAQYQLGEYESSYQIFIGLRMEHCADIEIGESARRGAAHATLQEQGNIGRADELLQELPISPARENLRITTFVTAARKGIRIPFREINLMISSAVDLFSGEVVYAHIINNGALALYEARKQSKSKTLLLEIVNFLEVALVMYKIAGAADNHLAGILFRISLVNETAGDTEKALSAIKESVNIWRGLVASQGGERYQKNLENTVSKMEELIKK